MSDAPKRIRRTPDEARRVILDAAEQVMAQRGPGGVRLQEVALAAGVSHPTILHHFESREGLIRALNQRALDDLGAVLKAQMRSAEASTVAAVNAAFAAYRGGLAQRVLWMLQAQAEISGEGRPSLQLFDDMVDGLHRLRCEHASPDRPPPPRGDSEAVVHLITISAFGDALVGPRLRRAPTSAVEEEARARFERWLGDLIEEHIVGGR